MTTAYLDYNIFTAIEDGELTTDKILATVDNNINAFPFSAGHIQEVDNITGKTEQQRQDFITKRLDTIGQISNRFYIYHELATNKIHWLTEEPKTVLDTIRQVPFGKTAMQMFNNLIAPNRKEEVRQALGIEPKHLNNYSPQQAVEQLNSKLTNLGTEENLIGLIEKGISYHPDGKNFGLHNRIAAIMEILDMFGYWKDKETDTSNYARLWDANHTFFASHCDYFVSDDKRTRHKARVVYDIYKIKTKVVSSNGTD